MAGSFAGCAGRAGQGHQVAHGLSWRAERDHDGAAAGYVSDFGLILCNLHKNGRRSCWNLSFLLVYRTKEARVGNGRFGRRSLEALGTMVC